MAQSQSSKNQQYIRRLKANVNIGSRESELAMYQANFVKTALSSHFPSTTINVIGIRTTGDKQQDIPLSAFSDKGIFTKELDVAIVDGRIDCAVHCVKDLETTMHSPLDIVSILRRGPKQDVVLMHPKYPRGFQLKDLPQGAEIGTSSLRRRALLSRLHPHLVVKDIRGNLNTRLRKLDEGNYDAIVLARAGVDRLGWSDRISQYLDMKEFPYAVGQGALAIVSKRDDEDLVELLSRIEDKTTLWVCRAERALLRALEGGCKIPIGVNCYFSLPCEHCGLVNSNIFASCQACFRSLDSVPNLMTLYVCISKPDGTEFMESEVQMEVTSEEDCDAFGTRVGHEFRERGAGALVAQIRAIAEKS